MTITDRNLTPGTRLAAHFKGLPYICEVKQDEGKTVFVWDGNKYKSPSAAGSAVMGGTACNGWRFWSVEGEMAEGQAPSPLKNTHAAGAPFKVAKVFYRSPNQKGLSEGVTRYYCNACATGFTGAGPIEACPVGHRNDDRELTQPA